MQVRVYELSQLSLKFERHFDAEIVDFQACFSQTCSSDSNHPVGNCIASMMILSEEFGLSSCGCVAQILSEDYSKVAFLGADRTVQLHARYGAHFRTRVPCFGRDLAYAPESADLLIAGSAPEIYRSIPACPVNPTSLPISSQQTSSSTQGNHRCHVAVIVDAPNVSKLHLPPAFLYTD